MYFRFIAWLPISAFMRIINFPLAPIVVLFANEEGWLPKWLWWFQTPDYSLDGDGGWRREHMPFKFESNKFQRWVNRWRWLWRNATYGFSYNVKGFKIKPNYVYWSIGDEKVSNRPLCEGLVKRYLINGDGRKYFQWYYVKAWSKKRCWRINIGWKLWGKLEPGKQIQYVCSPSPLNSYAVKK